MLPHTPALRRLALPLGLSLGAHVLLLGLVALLTAGSRPCDSPAAEGGSSFLIRLLSSPPAPQARTRPQPRPQPAPPLDNDWPIDVDATLVKPRIDPGPLPGAVAGAAARPGMQGSGGVAGGSAPGLLAVPPAARRVVYLVDRSISMGPSGALATARKEVAASLRSLPAGALFQVVPYNRLGEPLEMAGGRGLVPAEPATVEQAIRLLDDVQPEGATDHARGLRCGLQLRPDAIFLVTDAADLSAGDVPVLVRLLGHSGATLHVIELARGGPGRSEGPLAMLARGSGGSYRRVWPER
jgi:hypothetical protein